MEETINISRLTEEAKEQSVDVDIFKHLYMVFKDHAVTDSDAMSNNLTSMFWQGIADKVRSGELVVVEVRGEVRSSKSTVAAKLIHDINQLIFSLGKRSSKVSTEKCIMADQTEFVRFIRKDEMQIAIMIDEYNTMAEGGANASTEQQLLQSFADIFASRYIHRVSCNPTRQTDSNAFIHLTTMGKKNWGYYVNELQEDGSSKQVFLGRHKKFAQRKDAYVYGGFTRCKLSYFNALENDIQVLGYVDIYVEDIIGNWLDNVQHLFEGMSSSDWTEQDKSFIDSMKKKDWYVSYMVKKKLRQNLTINEGIRDIRELEFSTVVLGVYKELLEYAENEKVDVDMLVATIKDVCRAEQKIYSSYAEIDVLAKVRSLLPLITKEASIVQKLSLKKLTSFERKRLEVILRIVRERFQKRLHEEARLAALYKEYLAIT